MVSDNRHRFDKDKKNRKKSRQQAFHREIQRKLARRLKAQRDKDKQFHGIQVFGIVGWSVAVPMLLGIALGVWIDSKWPSSLSWTLILLLAGLIFGCLNAWFWIEASRRG